MTEYESQKPLIDDPTALKAAAYEKGVIFASRGTKRESPFLLPANSTAFYAGYDYEMQRQKKPWGPPYGRSA